MGSTVLGQGNMQDERPDDGTFPPQYKSPEGQGPVTNPNPPGGFAVSGGTQSSTVRDDEAHARIDRLEQQVGKLVDSHTSLASSHAELRDSHGKLQQSVPTTHSGMPEEKVLTVRETLPRGGFMHHDVVVSHDGFGHFRVTNMAPDAPYHTSFDAAKQSVIDNGQFEGSVAFGQIDPSKGWVPEE